MRALSTLGRPHWQRGWRLITETVTLVMRFFFTTMLQSTASRPPSPSICSLAVPTFWRSTAIAVAQRLELDRIEIERRRRGRRYRLDLDIADAAVDVAGRQPEQRQTRRARMRGSASDDAASISGSRRLERAEQLLELVGGVANAVGELVDDLERPRVLADLQQLVDEILAGLQLAQQLGKVLARAFELA